MSEASHEKPVVSLLLIEDNYDYADMVVDKLKSAEYFSYYVTRVGSFSEAQRKLLTFGYDIILLDIHLPNGAGRELIKNVRKLAPRERTALIVITGVSELDEEIEARKVLANDYIEKKPPNEFPLLLALRNWSIWSVGCREAREKMTGMQEVKDKIDETIRVQETVVIAAKDSGSFKAVKGGP